MFYGIKAQIYGDKKNVASVPHITIFVFRTYNSLRILKSHGIVSLTLETSLRIAGDVGIYKFQLLNFGHFFLWILKVSSLSRSS